VPSTCCRTPRIVTDIVLLADPQRGIAVLPRSGAWSYVASLRSHLREIWPFLVLMEILTVGALFFGGWSRGAPLDWCLDCLFVAADDHSHFEMSLFNAARRQRPAAILECHRDTGQAVASGAWRAGARSEN